MEPNHRLSGLDGLRAVAVIGVMLAHIGWYIGPGGYLGVDVFFVLSGYLITRLLLAEKAATHRISLGRFYLRRALRLYPALVVAVVGCGLAGMRLYPNFGAWGRAATASLTYLMDIARALGFQADRSAGPLGVTWSLAVEEHFYLVWPIVLLLILRGRGSRRGVLYLSTCLALISWLGLVVAAGAGISKVSLYYQPEVRTSALFVGCALACVRVEMRDRTLRHLGAAALLGLLIVIQLKSSNASLSTYAVRMPLTWFLTAALIVSLTHLRTGVASALLSLRPVAYIGRISYGIYLYHLAIITVLAQENLRFSVRFTLDILLPIVAAAMSFHFVEQPFLRLKDRVAGRPRVAAHGI